jgi:hypothetical protein
VKRLKALAAKILLAVAGILVSLAAMEGVFRVFGLGPSIHRPSVEEVILPVGAEPVRAAHGYIPHSVVRSTFDSDPRGYFGPGAWVDHIHNSLGWRDREHDLEKPDGTIRILGLGDSYLWGQGVHPEDTLLARLERRLDLEMADVRVEAINSAVFGSRTTHQLASFEAQGILFDPDLVLLVFVPNDVSPPAEDPTTKRVGFFRDYTGIYLDPDRVDLPSRFLGWGWQVFLRDVRAREYIRESVAGFAPENPGAIECRRALEGIADLCRRHGIEFVVAIFPFLHGLDGDYPFRSIHEIVAGYCDGLGIRCIDLADRFPGCRGPELWVHPTDQHPNERAHALAAEALYEPIRSTLEARSSTP